MFVIFVTFTACFAIKVLISKPKSVEQTVRCFRHDWIRKGEEDSTYLVCDVCHYLPEHDSFDYSNK
jgi:hypothetical protein